MTALNFSVEPPLVGKKHARMMMSSITLSTSMKRANKTIKIKTIKNKAIKNKTIKNKTIKHKNIKKN